MCRRIRQKVVGMSRRAGTAPSRTVPSEPMSMAKAERAPSYMTES
jgi:hypothetical protein